MNRIRALVAVAVFAFAGLMASVGLANPAQAGSPCYSYPYKGTIYVICPPIQHVVYQVKHDPCFCPQLAISFEEDLALPVEAQTSYVSALVQGIDLIGQAASTGDPAIAAGLRDQARQSFVKSAGELATATVRVYQIGVLDATTGTVDPDPNPWFQAAGADIVEGLQLTQQAIASGSPDRLEAAAMTAFSDAYSNLQQAAAGG